MHNISFLKENNFVFVFFFYFIAFSRFVEQFNVCVKKKNPAKQFTSNKQNKPTFLKTELNNVYCKSFRYKI